MGYSVEETIRYNQLFDVYQNLLTEKQKDYFRYYFSDDYSLSEISEILKVSRNAVHLQIRGIIKNLENFEEKLEFVKKNSYIDDLLKALEKEDLTEESRKLIKIIEKVK